MSSTTDNTTPTTTPTTTSSFLNSGVQGKPCFYELKKELKYIEKLTKQNLDIKTWASELKTWIKYQHVTDPETIFIACILTSAGEPREIIQELENYDSFSEDEDSDFDSDSEDDEEEEDESTSTYPSLDKVINHLKKFYGLKESQTSLLRELRSLKIKKNEKVKDFNTRYKTLYHKLDKKHRRKISVLDYADSLANNQEAWKRVMLKDHLSLSKAYEIAEKVDRLTIRNFIEPQVKSQYSSYNSKSNFKKKTSFEYQKPKQNKEVTIDELTNKMKDLKISTCLFCSEKGHYQGNCPKLNAIIESNRQKLFKTKRLNH